ncbi:MAG: hypothetical protein U9O94_01905 [Nanoarchaeota archaeon]|nr:hypothetical protein [Nanoarchaeota archaeon]
MGFIIAMASFSLYTTVFSPLASWLLLIIVFGFIGWTIMKDHNGTVKMAAWGGVLSGAIAGFAGAIIAVLMYNFVPSMVQFAVNQAVQRGADAAMVESFMKLGIYIGLITGPLMNGILGGIISLITGLIAKKV